MPEKGTHAKRGVSTCSRKGDQGGRIRRRHGLYVIRPTSSVSTKLAAFPSSSMPRALKRVPARKQVSRDIRAKAVGDKCWLQVPAGASLVKVQGMCPSAPPPRPLPSLSPTCASLLRAHVDGANFDGPSNDRKEPLAALNAVLLQACPHVLVPPETRVALVLQDGIDSLRVPLQLNALSPHGLETVHTLRNAGREVETAMRRGGQAAGVALQHQTMELTLT